MVTGFDPCSSDESSNSISSFREASRVAMWLPANSPAVLLKHVGPQDISISFTLRNPGYSNTSPMEG